jgi:hypothetical protein
LYVAATLGVLAKVRIEAPLGFFFCKRRDSTRLAIVRPIEGVSKWQSIKTAIMALTMLHNSSFVF